MGVHQIRVVNFSALAHYHKLRSRLARAFIQRYAGPLK
jgi:hypothetical protein